MLLLPSTFASAGTFLLSSAFRLSCRCSSIVLSPPLQAPPVTAVIASALLFPSRPPASSSPSRASSSSRFDLWHRGHLLLRHLLLQHSLQSRASSSARASSVQSSILFTPMKKQGSKLTPGKLQEDTVVQEEKPSPAPKKAVNEIDEIFAEKKRKKSEPKKTGKRDDETKRTDDKKKKMKKKKKTRELDDCGFLDPPSRPRKKTNDGFSIYTEDELGINKANAGSTSLCPFDCSCCF